MRIPAAALIPRTLRGWAWSDLGGDLAAGLTLAAIAIPEQMATARLAGFSPEIGLFAFVAGSLAFAIFGASRTLSVGADSTIAPIFAGGLALLAAAGSPAYAGLAAALALLVGLILVLGGLFRMGWIANLLSVPVTTGFLAGIAVHIVVLQLPAFLGTPEGSGDLAARITTLAAAMGRLNPAALAIGAGVLVISLAFEKINPRLPGALVGLLAATLAVIVLHLENQGVSVIGTVSGQLPPFAPPAAADMLQLIGLALIVSVVVMVQTAATTRAFAAQQDDINRDFIGVGAGSLLSGLFGLFPVNASPPRTAVVAQSGGRSQGAGLLAALAVGLLIVFGPGLLTHVPSAALAGVLLFIALRIVRVPVFVQVYRSSRGEFALILATMIAIVVLPIQVGVTVGVFLSLLHGFWTITRARMIALVKVPGTSVWWPPSGGAAGGAEGGVLVLAYQAPLSFLNAQHFQSEFLDRIGRAREPLKAVILEASSVVEIDYTASQVLTGLIEHCRTAHIRLAIARLESLRAQTSLERFGIIEKLGPDAIFRSVQDAVDALVRDGVLPADA
ncbi:MAG: SulP family inorganic anion transporter [Alphaproteobacteria bacterium]|nr:SulP family inorganic anion transporter [Alphaproteobacteria bacterium]